MPVVGGGAGKSVGKVSVGKVIGRVERFRPRAPHPYRRSDEDRNAIYNALANDMNNGVLFDWQAVDWQAVERHYGFDLTMLLKLTYETGTTSTPETGATGIY